MKNNREGQVNEEEGGEKEDRSRRLYVELKAKTNVIVNNTEKERTIYTYYDVLLRHF